MPTGSKNSSPHKSQANRQPAGTESSRNSIPYSIPFSETMLLDLVMDESLDIDLQIEAVDDSEGDEPRVEIIGRILLI